MTNRYVLGIVALSLVAVLGAGMVSAFGFGNGFGNPEVSEEDKSAMQEQRGAMQSAIENRDYDAWKSLMEAQIEQMKAQITEENFEKIVESHQQMSEMKKAMQEARTQFCEDNECPADFDGKDSDFQKHGGMTRSCLFVE